MNPVLVSDLDDTLTYSIKQEDGELYIFVNMKMIDILHRAMILRRKGKIDAILLLTNNTNRKIKVSGIERNYLDITYERIVNEYNNKYTDNQIESIKDIFDNIYTAEKDMKRTYDLIRNIPGIGYPNKYKPGPSMNGLRFRETKNINTVSRMLRNKSKNVHNLEKRVYFFDDETIDHEIKKEIEGKGGQYITIIPPFHGQDEDKTNFAPVYTMLEKLEKQRGGARTRRKRKTL